MLLEFGTGNRLVIPIMQEYNTDKDYFTNLFFIGVGGETVARKSYSAQEREEIRQALLATVLRCIAQNGLIHTSVDSLCREVGISKTFFYTFFPSKEELVLQALCHQQPRLLHYAQSLMEDPALSWRQGVERFLRSCCYGRQENVAVLSIEEEQAIFRCLTPEHYRAFQQRQLWFYSQLLTVFEVPVERVDPRLFGNMALTMMMVCRAMPEGMPFLFPEIAGDMVEFQIRAIVDSMEQARKEQKTPRCIPDEEFREG